MQVLVGSLGIDFPISGEFVIGVGGEIDHRGCMIWAISVPMFSEAIAKSFALIGVNEFVAGLAAGFVFILHDSFPINSI